MRAPLAATRHESVATYQVWWEDPSDKSTQTASDSTTFKITLNRNPVYAISCLSCGLVLEEARSDSPSEQ